MNKLPVQRYIKRSLELAKLGLGFTRSNPLVGAVLVNNGRIIGEGYHQKYGGPHAEVNTINSVKPADRHLIASSTLYVNLEPCSHHGKTPPCADLIIENSIPKVVIANIDPHLKVAGRGVKKLEEAGIEVITGVLSEEGELLNRRFFTFHCLQRPHIILKWAQSADGFFTKDKQEQHWITEEPAKKLVHRWRTEEMAIMVGTNTVLVDNPRLNNRYWPDREAPLRVIIDRSLKIDPKAHVLDGSTPTLVFTEQAPPASQNNITYQQLPFDETLLPKIFTELYKRNIISVLVEGGATLLNELITQGLWDEARVFTGSLYLGEGIPAPKLPVAAKHTDKVGIDQLGTYFND